MIFLSTTSYVNTYECEVTFDVYAIIDAPQNCYILYVIAQTSHIAKDARHWFGTL